MEIAEISLHQTPFDSKYREVPDFRDPQKVIEYNTFTDYLKRFVNNYYSIAFNDEVTAKSFAPNDETTIIIKTSRSLDEIKEFNYCIVNTTDGQNFAYFVDNVVQLNALNDATIQLMLTRDLWVEYYDIIRKNPVYAKAKRCHTKCINDNYEPTAFVDDCIENFDTKPLSKQTYVPRKGKDITVIWARYTINPEIDIYSLTDGVYEEITGSPHSSYGSLRYLFCPVRAFENFDELFDMIIYKDVRGNEGIVNIYDRIPMPNTENVVKMDFTTYIPVSYSYSTGTVEIEDVTYKVLTIQCNGIAESVGNVFIKINEDYFGFGSRGTNKKMLYFDSDGGIVKHTFEYEFDDLSAINRVYNPYSNDITHLPEFYVSPFRYYTLILPDGSSYPLKFNRPIKKIWVEVKPSANGGCYRIAILLWDSSEYIIDYDTTSHTFTCNGDVAFTQDAYKNYLLRNGYSYGVNLQYKKDNINMHQKWNNIDSAAQITSDLAVSLATGGLYVSTSKHYKNLKEGERLELEEDYVENSHLALMKDLQNQATVTSSSSGDFDDYYVQDRIILIKNEVIHTGDLIPFADSVIQYGVPTHLLTNPLSNRRTHYDYIQCENYYSRFITNQSHKEFFNTLFSRGVRKWHIDRLNTDEELSLNPYIENGGIYE